MNCALVYKSPLYSGNIGAIARIAKNFDIKEISLVNPRCEINGESRKYATHSKDILEKIQIFNSLEASLKHYNIVFGTSARKGSSRTMTMLTPESAVKVCNNLEGTAAILFGPEDKGLTNDDLAHCHYIINIPVSNNHSSLNLSHATALLAYEFFKQKNTKTIPKIPYKKIRPASFEEWNQLFKHFESVLSTIDYFKHEDHNHMLNSFKRMSTKAQLSSEDITIARGVLRQLSWYIGINEYEITKRCQ